MNHWHINGNKTLAGVAMLGVYLATCWINGTAPEQEPLTIALTVIAAGLGHKVLKSNTEN